MGVGGGTDLLNPVPKKRKSKHLYGQLRPPVSTKKNSVYHNLSPVFLCPEGSSVMLFAPKMLLEDL